jgi:predicted HTH domain antitoxin
MNTSVAPSVFPVSVPENFEMAVHLTRPELDHHLRLMAALKMFELGQISSGKAAELVGMTRVDFLHTCGRYRISVFNYPPEEAEAEILRDLETFSQHSST